ncbi:MAG: hypothetical protein OEX00_05365 [Gammaproteobacteria bacterium]|nr:hypothetical protein [Gammaproteobacteria bacterium]MDH5693301.1 hypothetical protein [Gammaproteobacteria bacterium]
MQNLQKPIVNAWYTNLTGQLFRVKALSYEREGLSRIVIVYLDGKQQIINRQEWECLKLIKRAVSKRDPSREIHRPI